MTLATHLNWGIDGLDYTSGISELTYQLNGYDNYKDLFCEIKIRQTHSSIMTINCKCHNWRRISN